MDLHSSQGACLGHYPLSAWATGWMPKVGLVHAEEPDRSRRMDHARR